MWIDFYIRDSESCNMLKPIADWKYFDHFLDMVLKQSWSEAYRENLRTVCLEMCKKFPATQPDEYSQRDAQFVVGGAPKRGWLGGLLKGEAPRIPSYKSTAVICGGTFSDRFDSWKRVVVLDGVFTEDTCFRDAENVVVFGGVFAGDGAFRRAKNVVVIGGKFEAEGAFGESSKTIVYDGEFGGDAVFVSAVKPVVLGGNWAVKRMGWAMGVFGERSMNQWFENAVDAKVWLPGKLACVDKPASGVFAANEIENIRCYDVDVKADITFLVFSCQGSHVVDRLSKRIFNISSPITTLKKPSDIETAVKALRKSAAPCPAQQ